TVPQLSVTDLVATRGDGVFETIGAFDGKPVNVGPHLARLARSAAQIDLPEPDQAVLARAVDAAIAAHAPVEELSVRVMLTRGIEGEGVPTCWIHARVSDDWSPYRAGIRVAVLDRGLPTTVTESSPWLLPGAKTLSYAVNMAAVREAKRRGADDVLFLASDGYVLEGPTSTLMVRRGDGFLTTPVSAGVLPGTSVRTLFDHLHQDGFAVGEELMTVEDVTGSDGAWLLSSTRLAAPITHLDDAVLPVDPELTAHFQLVLKGQA
ncbi:MAG TPA: aminotransferase class IV, partial [Brachybacterium sp.]|nr:aminotransferase class IV [Brachybacterium sp.]